MVTPVMMIAKGGVTYIWIPAQGLNRYDNDTVYASPGTNTMYTVYATDANNCTASTSVNVAVKTGIKSSGAMNAITVYPNPVSDNFTIDNENDAIFESAVYNAIGQQIFTAVIS